jgi:hypothetical protein
VNSTGTNADADSPGPAPRIDGRSQRTNTAKPSPERQVPDSDQGADSDLTSEVPGISRIGRIFGAVVAPTTLLTALLYYFGWAHAYYFFGYFGVNSTLLGFTTTDYLIRSVDALFVPMTIAAIAVLAGLWIDGVLRKKLIHQPADPISRAVIIALTAGALALVVIGGISTFVYRTVLNQYAAAAPLSFAVGVLLLAYVVHVRRYVAATEHKSPAIGARPWAGAVEWAVVFALVGISLFAAATDYAAAVGSSRAQHFAAFLSGQPDVVVFAEKDLSLHAPGVSELRCRDPLAAYKFRYEGLKLVLQSGGLYLFLPETWTQATGAAILMPQSNMLRLEFYSASHHAGSQGPAC